MKSLVFLVCLFGLASPALAEKPTQSDITSSCYAYTARLLDLFTRAHDADVSQAHVMKTVEASMKGSLVKWSTVQALGNDVFAGRESSKSFWAVDIECVKVLSYKYRAQA